MEFLKKTALLIFAFIAGTTNLCAQIATVGTTRASHNNGSTHWSVAVSPVAGDTLLVGCDFNSGVSFVGVSDTAGDTFTLIAHEADSTNFAARVYLAMNVKGGSTTVTCTAASGPPNNEIYVTELKGVNPSVPIDKALSLGGSTSPASGSITTTNPNEFLWAYIISGAVTKASGWASLSSFDENLVASKAQAVPGTVAPSFRVTMNWTLLAVALNPTGSVAPPPISVSLSPSAASVQASQSARFVATIQNDSQEKGVTWSLSGAGCSGATCGSLSNVTTTSVTYTAPVSAPTPATVTLLATSVTDSTKSASATLTVSAPPPISVSVSPGTASVQASQSARFVATIQNDSQEKGVTWSLSGAGCSGATCGSLSNVTTTSVTYTAPVSAPTPATVTLLATSVTDSTKSASATLTVSAPPPISVSVSPGTASVQASQSARFVATIQNDSQNKGVTWTLSGADCSGATCGSLSNVTTTSVTYTAPASVPTPAAVTLLATSLTDSTKSASAALTVTAPPPISVSVSPATTSVQVSQSAPFTVTLQNDSQNKGVTWTLSGAGCSGASCCSLSNVTTTSVTYTAPASVPTPAAVTLLATSVTDNTKSATATLTVTADPPISVSVSPGTASVQVSQSAPFTTTIQNDSQNKGVTWTLSGTGCSGATCGSLSNVTTTSVTYTAPASVPTPTAVTLLATSVTDNTRSATATLTVTASATTSPAEAQVPALVSGFEGSSSGTSNASPMKVPLPDPSIAGNYITVKGYYALCGACSLAITDDQSNSYTTKVSTSDGNIVVVLARTSAVATAGTRYLTFTWSGGAHPGFAKFSVGQVMNIATSSPDDGTGTGNGSSSTPTCSSTTPTASGDWVEQETMMDGSGIVTSWTAGSQSDITWSLFNGYTGQGGDSVQDAAQYGVYNSTTALEPTMTMNPSNTWNTGCMFLKAGSSGASLPAGIQLISEHHVNTASGASNSLTWNFPVRGNVHVIFGNASFDTDIVSITSSPSLTWTRIGTEGMGTCTTGSTGGYGGFDAFYAIDSSPSLAMTVTINTTASGNTSPGTYAQGTLAMYDIQSAGTLDANGPFCANGNNTGGTTNWNGVTISSPKANGLYLTMLSNSSNQTQHYSPGVPDIVICPFTDTGACDENDAHAHYYPPSTSSFTSNWTSDAPTGPWAEVMIGFAPLP